MNVAKLIAHLQTFPAYYEVVLAKNSKGDCFSPAETIGESMFVPWKEVPFEGNVGELVITDKKKNNCVYLIPKF